MIIQCIRFKMNQCRKLIGMFFEGRMGNRFTSLLRFISLCISSFIRDCKNTLFSDSKFFMNICDSQIKYLTIHNLTNAKLLFFISSSQEKSILSTI